MNAPLLITDRSQLDGAVGKLVKLQGAVTNTRQPSLVGCEVESDSPDLRGESAVAVGVLEREVVTQEQIDRETAAHGLSSRKGPGTYYQLVDAATGRLAQVQRP